MKQTSEALQTGLFTYFAHPDVIHFTGSEKDYEQQMRALCEAAKATDTPLEFNLLGMRLGRYYPDERFWAIAGEIGNTVVLGCDAHKPEDVCGGVAELEALRMVRKYSLRLRETITLRQLRY